MTARPGGDRRGAAVLGSPIAHSLSPVLHLAAYDALGLAGWTYRAVECTEADLDTTLDRLDAEGLVGVSLTMPLKRQVLSRLAQRDPWTQVVGAANTVLFDDANGWAGANTDVPGMVTALEPTLGGRQDGLTSTVLGAGATAASAIAAVAELGGREVTVVARRPEAAADLARVGAALGVEVATAAWSQVAGALDRSLVISTTPAGVTDELASGLPAVRGVLFDVVYAPWPTPLARAWQAAGGTVVGGLELLVEQAALQVELMTGQAAPVEPMRRAGYAAVAG